MSLVITLCELDLQDGSRLKLEAERVGGAIEEAVRRLIRDHRLPPLRSASSAGHA